MICALLNAQLREVRCELDYYGLDDAVFGDWFEMSSEQRHALDIYSQEAFGDEGLSINCATKLKIQEPAKRATHEQKVPLLFSLETQPHAREGGVLVFARASAFRAGRAYRCRLPPV